MSLIEWRDDFCLRTPSVDHEHEELILLINELYDNYLSNSSKVTIMDSLCKLHAKIVSHFTLEEKIMHEQIWSSHYDVHKTEHEQLLGDICDLMNDYEDDEPFREGVFGEILKI